MKKASLPVIGLLIFGAALRLFDLTDQPIDFHPTRQLRGAIVARGMYYEMLPGVLKNAAVDENTRNQAINFWYSTGRYEPPILERLVAITCLGLRLAQPGPGTDPQTGAPIPEQPPQELLEVARIYSTLFWCIGGLALYALARRFTGLYAAFIALAYYLVLPFSVQASRSFQPDPGMVMWLLLFTYALYRWSETRGLRQPGPQDRQSWKWALLAGSFAGIAILTKAVIAYTVAGAAIALVLYTSSQAQVDEAHDTVAVRQAQKFNRLKRFGHSVLRILRDPLVWCMALIMILPTIVYYLGQGGRVSEYFSTWTLALSRLLLDPSLYVRWLNLVQSLLGWWALILAVAGIIFAPPRARALLAGLWLGYILYGLFLPYQMYTHNYYHLQLVPLVALSMAPTIGKIVEWISSRNKVLQLASTAAALLLFVYLSWQALIPLYSQNYRNEPAYWQKIASYLPADGKIMALTQDYGYRLMYYGWRKVALWPNRGEIKLNQLRSGEKAFQEYFAKHTEGFSYFLITAFRQFDDQPELKGHLYNSFPTVADTQGYVIFDLTRPKVSQP